MTPFSQYTIRQQPDAFVLVDENGNALPRNFPVRSEAEDVLALYQNADRGAEE